jgi:hypothetical protein
MDDSAASTMRNDRGSRRFGRAARGAQPEGKDNAAR